MLSKLLHTPPALLSVYHFRISHCGRIFPPPLYRTLKLLGFRLQPLSHRKVPTMRAYLPDSLILPRSAVLRVAYAACQRWRGIITVRNEP